MQQVTLVPQEKSNSEATALDLTIKTLEMKADLDGINATLIKKVDLLDFEIDFNSLNESTLFVSGRLLVLFELPSNIRMNFTVLETTIDSRLRSQNQSIIGQMKFDHLFVEHDQSTNEILVEFKRTELLVLDRQAFQDFAADLLLRPNVSISIDGKTIARARTPIGDIDLADIPVRDQLDLIGYNRFGGGNLKINQIDIKRSLSSDELELQVLTEIRISSVVHIFYGGLLTLSLYETTNQINLGQVIIDPFYIDQQNKTTILSANGFFRINDNNRMVATQFISNMISGLNNNIQLRGQLDDGSIGTTVHLLSTAVKQLRIDTQLPGLTDERSLVQAVRIKKLSAAQVTGLPFGLVKVLPTRIRLFNPFTTSVSINNIQIRADFSATVSPNLQVGLVNDTQTIVIPPNQQILTPYFNVSVTASLPTMIALAGPLLSGAFGLTLSGFLDVTIDDNVRLTRVPVTFLNVTSSQESSF